MASLQHFGVLQSSQGITDTRHDDSTVMKAASEGSEESEIAKETLGRPAQGAPHLKAHANAGVIGCNE